MTRETHTHCQCDFCTGEDCGQDDPEQYEADQQAEKDAIRDEVLDKFKEIIRLHDEDELLYPDLYNEFLVIYKSLRRGRESPAHINALRRVGPEDNPQEEK
jgi:hypothetical protein